MYFNREEPPSGSVNKPLLLLLLLLLLLFNVILHFKVCVGVSRGIKHSNPRYEGHFSFFSFFLMFGVNLLTLYHSLRLASLQLTSDCSFARLLFANIIVILPTNR